MLLSCSGLLRQDETRCESAFNCSQCSHCVRRPLLLSRAKHFINTLGCLPDSVALAIPIQRLNCAGQRSPTRDEMQEFVAAAATSSVNKLPSSLIHNGSIQHPAKEPGVLLLLWVYACCQSDIQQTPLFNRGWGLPTSARCIVGETGLTKDLDRHEPAHRKTTNTT